MNAPEDRKGYYDAYWSAPIHSDNPYLRWKTEFTVAHPKIRTSEAIVDIGCGPGAVLRALQPTRVRLVGVEISAGAAKALTEAGLEGVSADLEEANLPFPDATFDSVLCFDVFEHLFAPARLLADAHRVLRPGGSAFFCVPNALNAYNRVRFALGRHVDIMDTSHHEGEMFSNHIRLFSKALFEEFLDAGGFEPLEKHFYFPTTFGDETQPMPSGLAKFITAPRLHDRWPALFALAFLYVCRKRLA